MLLTANHIAKQYADKMILNHISFSLEQHTTLSILGKSGCGKSTLLKIIAGIEPQDRGTLFLQGKDISQLSPERRNIIYIFQEALLFPHLTVFENIAFGLQIRKEPTNLIKERVISMLDSLELTDHIHKSPHELSGGQKQRVAFGRALIVNPGLLLLDEPFSSLDVEIRATMQNLYKSIARQYDITAIFVTHDLKEALLMGDAISYMEDGQLEIFADKAAFIRDKRTGVQNEISFWSGLV